MPASSNFFVGCARAWLSTIQHNPIPLLSEGEPESFLLNPKGIFFLPFFVSPINRKGYMAIT